MKNTKILKGLAFLSFAIGLSQGPLALAQEAEFVDSVENVSSVDALSLVVDKQDEQSPLGDLDNLKVVDATLPSEQAVVKEEVEVKKEQEENKEKKDKKDKSKKEGKEKKVKKEKKDKEDKPEKEEEVKKEKSEKKDKEVKNNEEKVAPEEKKAEKDIKEDKSKEETKEVKEKKAKKIGKKAVKKSKTAKAVKKGKKSKVGKKKLVKKGASKAKQSRIKRSRMANLAKNRALNENKDNQDNNKEVLKKETPVKIQGKENKQHVGRNIKRHEIGEAKAKATPKRSWFNEKTSKPKARKFFSRKGITEAQVKKEIPATESLVDKTVVEPVVEFKDKDLTGTLDAQVIAEPVVVASDVDSKSKDIVDTPFIENNEVSDESSDLE